jgi:hypothetical protein
LVEEDGLVRDLASAERMQPKQVEDVQLSKTVGTYLRGGKEGLLAPEGHSRWGIDRRTLDSLARELQTKAIISESKKELSESSRARPCDAADGARTFCEGRKERGCVGRGQPLSLGRDEDAGEDTDVGRV